MVGELSRLVTAQNLLEISELEQNIVNNGEHNQCLEGVRRLIQNPKTTDIVSFCFLYKEKGYIFLFFLKNKIRIFLFLIIFFNTQN